MLSKDGPKSTPMTRTRNRGADFSPALPRDSLGCRVAMRPRGGVTPPTPQWSALGILDQRSYRWLRRRMRESLCPPNRRWSRMSDRNKRSARSFPAPRRSLTGEGDLLAVEARLVADHGTSAALTLQAVALETRDGSLLISRRSCPQLQAARRVIIALLHGY